MPPPASVMLSSRLCLSPPSCPPAHPALVLQCYEKAPGQALKHGQATGLYTQDPFSCTPMQSQVSPLYPPEHPSPVLQCDEKAPGQALEHQPIALTGLTHSGHRHNGQQLLKVLHQHPAGGGGEGKGGGGTSCAGGTIHQLLRDGCTTAVQPPQATHNRCWPGRQAMGGWDGCPAAAQRLFNSSRLPSCFARHPLLAAADYSAPATGCTQLLHPDPVNHLFRVFPAGSLLPPNCR